MRRGLKALPPYFGPGQPPSVWTRRVEPDRQIRNGTGDEGLIEESGLECTFRDLLYTKVPVIVRNDVSEQTLKQSAGNVICSVFFVNN